MKFPFQQKYKSLNFIFCHLQIMPFKTGSSKRLSTKKICSDYIPIYQILSNKQNREPLNDLIPEVQSLLKRDPIALKSSFLDMLIKFSGLEEYSTKINSENGIMALTDILNQAYEIKKTLTTPLILSHSDKFHKQFVKRIQDFLKGIISQQVGILTNNKVQFNQSFTEWLQLLTNSKMRIIRSSSIQFTRLLIQQQINYYQQCHQNRQSKKAFTVSKNIINFLEKIIAPRYNDIDQSIRQTAFQTTSILLEHMSNDIMTEQLLNKIFTTLFQQRIQILDLLIKLFQRMIEKLKQPKVLMDYLKQHLPKIIQISKNTQYIHTNILALKIVQALHHRQQTLKILNRDYLIALLQNFSTASIMYGLQAVIQIFYQSLYNTVEEIQTNSSVVLFEMINLLMGISGQKNLNIILKSFFNFKKFGPQKVFNIDNMFNLLISQFYRNQYNQEVRFKEKQINILLIIITQWIDHSIYHYQHGHLSKQKLTYQKILQTFNNHILVNCKQLFFQKMTQHPAISEKYLALFTHLHPSTITFSEMETYLDFIYQKMEKLFGEHLGNVKVYKEIIDILQIISNDQKLSHKYSPDTLLSKVPLANLTAEDYSVTSEQVYRVSALLSKFSIRELVNSINFLNNMINAFAQSRDDLQKLQILIIFHFIHYYNFMHLLKDTSYNNQTIYKTTRNKIIQLYLQIISNNAENISVKLGAFRGLVYTLRIISNKKFQETNSPSRANAYELSNDHIKIVYQFVTNQLFSTDSLDYSSLDVTRMMEKMSLETHQIKADIINLLFQLYQESYVFTCHQESARFLITLIKAEHQFHKSRTANTTLSLDLTKYIQMRLKKLLSTYLKDEIKPSNMSKIVYWRLCSQIFTQSRQDEKFEIIMDKILVSCFDQRLSEEKKKQTNKLMIFILHAFEKIIDKKDFIQLDIYETLFRKIYKKFQKNVLIRIKEYFIEKSSGIDNIYLKNFIETLSIIARAQQKKNDKKTFLKDLQNDDSSDEKNQESSAESEEQKDENQRKLQNKQPKTIQHKKARGRKQKNSLQNSDKVVQVEDDEQSNQQVHGNPRFKSQTKKKIK